MRADAGSPDPLDVVQCRRGPDGLHDRRTAGLETMWRMVVGDSAPRAFLDHLAAALVWRQLLKKFSLAVKHADTRGAINFVPSENVEVCIEVAHVDVKVHGALRAIDQHGDRSLVRDSDELLDWDRGPKHVRHLRYRDNLRSIAQSAFECVERKGAIVADIDPSQHRALAFTVEVPRHNIGVMITHAEYDLIAGADVRKAETRCNEIDRLSRRPGENDLLVRGG